MTLSFSRLNPQAVCAIDFDMVQMNATGHVVHGWANANRPDDHFAESQIYKEISQREECESSDDEQRTLVNPKIAANSNYTTHVTCLDQTMLNYLEIYVLQDGFAAELTTTDPTPIMILEDAGST